MSAPSVSSLIMATWLALMALAFASASAFALTLSQAQSQETSPQLVHVPTTSGLVRGFRWTSSNQSGYKFLSVPYAEAPIGQLRFRRPVELAANSSSSSSSSTNSGRLLVDATKYGKTCPQFRHLASFISPLLNLDQQHETSEDCLRLSIYVPATIEQEQATSSPRLPSNGSLLGSSARLPVIVWIPGEGFDFADERQFEGSHLAQQARAIVVSVQYRVGVLGFLNEPALEATGNMGVYDQLAALRWVNKNINAFGGDERRVTVMGRFSGSMAISGMLTAPQQRAVRAHDGGPLFRRAIMLSGLAVKDWIIERPAEQAKRARSLTKLAYERGFCSRAQLQDGSCLRELPVNRLLEISGYGWKLVEDDELIGQQDPIESLLERPERFAEDVEAVLLGETETEGTLCLYRHMLNQLADYAQLIEENRLTPAHLFAMIRDDSNTYFKYNVSAANPIQAALEALTAADKSLGAEHEELREKYLDACSSYMVKAHNNRFKRHLQARNQLLSNSVTERPVDIYHYSLKYKPSFSLAPDYIQTAAHGDDIPLIFGLVHNQPQQSIDQADLLMTQKLTSYIGNFVHGNHPLLPQHNSIEQATLRVASGNPNETSASLKANQTHPTSASSQKLATPLDATHASWANTNSNRIYTLALTESEAVELVASQRPFATDKVAIVSERDLAKLFGAQRQQHNHQQQQQQQQQQPAIHSQMSRLMDGGAAELRVVVLDGQHVVALASGGQLASGAQNQQLADESQQSRRAMTRSQRLLDFHHNRQQLLESGAITAAFLHRRDRSPLIMTRPDELHETGRMESASANIQTTSTTTATTNLFGAELSFMSSLLLSSCLLIVALMSFCIVLTAIVIRHNLNSN